MALRLLFAQHFSSIFTPKPAHSDEALTFTAAQIEHPDSLCNPFTKAEVLQVLSHLDTGKSTGPDDIPASFWKRTAECVASPLTQLFNESLSTGIFPTEWKIAHVKAIHKSGMRGAIENYRQISLLSCVGKVMAKLMCSRLTKAFGNIISERQHGFLSGRSTTTNLMEFVVSVKAAIKWIK